MASAEYQWPPLESNPEVFTEYLYQLGLPSDWFVGELFGLDEELLDFVTQPVLAVIVTFETLNKNEVGATEEIGTSDFFMKQTKKLDYACGVIACIHSVLNNLDKIQLIENSILEKYYIESKKKSFDERATILESMKEFQEAHNAFATLGQSSVPSNEADVKHHFIAFIRNSKGQLIELDGMKAGPIIVNPSSQDLLKDTATILKSRIETGIYSESLAALTLGKVAD